MLISLSGVGLAHGTRVLFRDVDLRVAPASRIALVGPNGAGKTTLLEIMAGERAPDEGEVARRKGLTAGLLRQEVAESAGRSVLDEVLADAPATRIAEELRRLERRLDASGHHPPDGLLDEYGHLQARFEQLGGYGLEAEARRILAGLGFEEARVDRDVGELSGGWMMRVALARLLLARPDLLLLDEPTNHLDLASVTWLEEFLLGYEGAVVVVSHDREFINGLATRVVELAWGTATEYVGDYAAFVAQREARLEQLRAAADNQRRAIVHTERFIERFRYKAKLASRVQSRVKALERLERIEVPEDRVRTLRFRFPDPPRSGRDVIVLEGVRKSYGENVVYDGLDLVLERGRKVALVGPNGAGKSTLLRILAGVEPIDAGARRVGHNVEVAYFAQHQVEALDLDCSVLEELTAVVDTRRVRPRSMLGAFGFTGDQVDQPVGVLSGGERTRLALAKLLAEPVNLLCVDEPTNHLDITGRDTVEDALMEYPGTVVLITHDRHLIRNVADTIVGIEAGRLEVFHGTYDEFVERAERPSASPDDDGRATTAGPDGDAARKRREAEHRNALYRRTRDARARLDAVEEELGAAEAEVAEVTRQLADPATYDDDERTRELVRRHGEAKDRAVALTARWERLYLAVEAATEAAERELARGEA